MSDIRRDNRKFHENCAHGWYDRWQECADSIYELFQLIESPSGLLELGLCSGFDMFYNMMCEYGEWDNMFSATSKEEHRQIILDRIKRLAERSIDERYRNPYDKPLALYLSQIAENEDSERTQKAIEYIQNAPNLWWAAMVVVYARQMSWNGMRNWLEAYEYDYA